MRSTDPADEGDLDLRTLRRTPARTTPMRKGWRRALIGGVISAVLSLFFAVVWFAYQDLMPGGDAAPPLIRAEVGPIKRQPDERGGLPVVNEESAVVQALDEPDAPVRVERIVPRQSTAPRSAADIVPEVLEAEPAGPEPILAESGTAEGTTGPARQAPGEADAADTLDALIADVAGGVEELREIEPAAGAATGTTGSASTGPAAADTGSRILVFDPRPRSAASDSPPASDQTVVAAATPALDLSPQDLASQELAPQEVAPQDDAPVLPAIRPLARSTPETPPAPVANSTPDPAQAPATQTASLPPTPALAADFAGAFRVQLLAVRDEEAAAGAWASLQEIYPGVLGSLRSRVQRADLGDNTFYRLQAGPFTDRAGAASVCSALQARGADCFVVEPTS